MHWFCSVNTMYSLTVAMVIWMIYGVSLAVSHSAASRRHMVGTALLFCLALGLGRALIKNSVFCWLPLNVCQRFCFILCAILATGYWGDFSSIFFHSVFFFCVPQEETLALRKAGSGVVLDSQLPHLIGIDEDLLSTGIILYHLKVNEPLWHFCFNTCLLCLRAELVMYCIEELHFLYDEPITVWKLFFTILFMEV